MIVGTLANIAGTQAVVGRKDLVLNSARDLEGKKVGMVRGAGVLIAFRNMAADLGVDIGKVQFINISPADQLAALDKGDIDALACWEPYITKRNGIGGQFLFPALRPRYPRRPAPCSGWISTPPCRQPGISSRKRDRHGNAGRPQQGDRFREQQS